MTLVPATQPGSRHGSDEMVKTTKMAPHEELALKVSDGLSKLTSILSSIDEKMVHQHRATELVAERLQTLPRVLEGLVAAERNNLETLRELRGSMEKQSEASLAASQKLEQLPTLVDGIGTRIDKQTEAAASVKTSVESVGSSVRGLVDGAQRAQSSLITEFRRGQDEQRLRLEELVERQRKTIVIVAAIGAFVVIGLFIVLTRLPK
jgi:GTP cyclohydrolase I